MTVVVRGKTRTVVVVKETPRVTIEQIDRPIEVVQVERPVQVVPGRLRGPEGPQGEQGPPGTDGGDTSTVGTALANDDLVTIIPGMPLARRGVGYGLARADDPLLHQVIGMSWGELEVPVGEFLAPRVEGIMELNLLQWEEALGTPGGLVAGRDYYLGATGRLVLAPPEAVGMYLVPIGVAITPLELHIRIDSPLQL